MDHNRENTKPQRSRKKLLFLALFASVGLFVVPVFFNQTIAQSIDKIEDKLEEIVERTKKLVFSEERYWQVASDDVTGVKYPGTIANDSTVGTLDWSGLTDIVSDNATYATVSLDDTDVSHYIKATNFGFTSTDVPTGSTILGIKVEVEDLGIEINFSKSRLNMQLVEHILKAI